MDKYHDKAYDTFGKHSAGWHKRHDRDQQQRDQQAPSSASGLSRTSHDTARGRKDSKVDSDMYAPDRHQERDYADRRDSRYVSDETYYYRGPDAGAVVMRGSDPYNNARAYEIQVRHTSNPQTVYC